jgi:hypothetical protein
MMRVSRGSYRNFGEKARVAMNFAGNYARKKKPREQRGLICAGDADPLGISGQRTTTAE